MRKRLLLGLVLATAGAFAFGEGSSALLKPAVPPTQAAGANAVSADAQPAQATTAKAGAAKKKIKAKQGAIKAKTRFATGRIVSISRQKTGGAERILIEIAGGKRLSISIPASLIPAAGLRKGEKVNVAYTIRSGKHVASSLTAKA